MKIRSCLDKELKCRISDGIKVMKAFRIGALEVIRTPDIRLRRPTLYPAELRAQYLVDTPQFSDTKGFMLFAHINLALSVSVIIC